MATTTTPSKNRRNVICQEEIYSKVVNPSYKEGELQ